jgi:hypothetical protein
MKDEKLLKFFNRCKQFLMDNYPVNKDSMGIPSVIEVFIEKKEYSITHSIDRHYLSNSIMFDLINNLCFDPDIAKKLSEMYVEEKFKSYKKYILTL